LIEKNSTINGTLTTPIKELVVVHYCTLRTMHTCCALRIKTETMYGQEYVFGHTGTRPALPHYRYTGKM